MLVFKKNILFILLLAFTCLKGSSQELPKGYKITMDMTVDEKGDVVVSSVTQYNAAYWENVKATKALEPSIMKNTVKRQFPKYQITDFEIDSKTKESDRISTMKFKILGSLKLDDNGKWIAELDTKSPDITKVSDTKFLLIDEASAQKITINLPASASGAKTEKDGFGKYNLTYTAPVSGGGTGNIIKWLGFLVAAGGIFLFFKSRGLNTVFVKNTQQQKINYKNTKEIDEAVIVNNPLKENITSANGFKNNQE
jgi:hypothetical protein